MGDDLIFAQKFTRTAADGLALLAEMENPRGPGDAPVVIDMMTTVQRGAKRLRARNIYTGAQEVLSALHHETDDILTGRIETLGSLVTEYARGLDELVTTPEMRSPKTEAEKWTAARDILNALLPSAAPETADMLSRLMRAPVTLEAVQPDLAEPASEAEIVPFIKFSQRTNDTAFPDLNIFEIDDSTLEDGVFVEDTPVETLPESEVIETVTAVEPAVQIDLPKTPQRDYSVPEITLDAMMRDVIADALSVARSIGRTISLSYDMGDRSVTEDAAQGLRHRLGQALSQIIRQALTDDRVGHIDVNLAGEHALLAGL